MCILQNISYAFPGEEKLFKNLYLNIPTYSKVALIGNNGTGKSTLLKIIAGIIEPAEGSVINTSHLYYVPQVFGDFGHQTIADALRVQGKLQALRDILAGNVSELNMNLLDDDWTIEERCREALAYWKLEGLDLQRQMNSLSGGQRTTLLLAGISIHQPEIILLDEPTNHLDSSARKLLYDLLQKINSTVIVVSHDRKLLNLLQPMYELSKRGITIYGGNYDFYVNQKIADRQSLDENLRSKEKALRKAKEIQRETIERQQKLDGRGKKKQEQSGVPVIMLNTLRNNAERSTSKLKGVHEEKTSQLSHDLNELRKEMPGTDEIKFNFDNTGLHNGKRLIHATGINYSYGTQNVWNKALDIQIVSADRIAIKGSYGSGKTTLVKILAGNLEPTTGSIYRTENKIVYIDQDYSLIKDDLTVYEQAVLYNKPALQEHEIKTRLNRFLFSLQYWNRPCRVLSGGEKMRLMLCCLTIQNQAPDIIILDEPTNNIDIQNIAILTAAINQYKGTLLVISHDDHFLKEIQVADHISLPAQ